MSEEMGSQVTPRSPMPPADIPEVVVLPDTPNSVDKPYACNRCDMRFAYAVTLGRHRRDVHGISGSSPAAIALRKSKAGVGSRKLVAKSTIFRCPKCPAKFDLKRSLGRHLTAKHGVPSMGATAVSRRRLLKAIAAGTALHCQLCPKLFHNAIGLNLHMQLIHHKKLNPTQLARITSQKEQTSLKHLQIKKLNRLPAKSVERVRFLGQE